MNINYSTKIPLAISCNAIIQNHNEKESEAIELEQKLNSLALEFDSSETYIAKLNSLEVCFRSLILYTKEKSQRIFSAHFEALTTMYSYNARNVQVGEFIVEMHNPVLINAFLFNKTSAKIKISIEPLLKKLIQDEDELSYSTDTKQRQHKAKHLSECIRILTSNREQLNEAEVKEKHFTLNPKTKSNASKLPEGNYFTLNDFDSLLDLFDQEWNGKKNINVFFIEELDESERSIRDSNQVYDNTLVKFFLTLFNKLKLKSSTLLNLVDFIEMTFTAAAIHNPILLDALLSCERISINKISGVETLFHRLILNNYRSILITKEITQNRNKEVIECIKILDRFGCDINHPVLKNEGNCNNALNYFSNFLFANTPLSLAIWQKDMEIALELIHAKADIDIKIEYLEGKKVTLLEACFFGKKTCTTLYIERIARMGANVFQKSFEEFPNETILDKPKHAVLKAIQFQKLSSYVVREFNEKKFPSVLVEIILQYLQ